MPISLLPWLLKGSSRPEYSEFVEPTLNEHTGLVSTEDLRILFICLACIIVARLLFNAAFLTTANRLAQHHGRDAAHKDGSKLLEEFWVLLGNIAVLAASTYVMLYRNGGCTFFSPRPCLAGWPNHPIDSSTATYYDFEIAWYVSLLLKPVLRYGQKDGRDMAAHHVASLVLLLASRSLHLSRFGVLVLALFGMSNPALHFAKITNQLNAPPTIRISAFSGFAALFFITRIVAVPVVILAPAALYSREWLPYAVQDFPMYYTALNVLLGVLYVLQWMWMKAIWRVLHSAANDGADAASHMSATVDPAKRYTAQGQHTNGKAE